jgi:isoleucyl-tRNA synthetase
MRFDKVSPQVDFPRLEEEILGLWERTGTFEKSVRRRPKERPFIFYEGPPTRSRGPSRI